LGFCYLIVYLWKKNGTSGGTHKRVDVKAIALFLCCDTEAKSIFDGDHDWDGIHGVCWGKNVDMSHGIENNCTIDTLIDNHTIHI
jgi:hypothetical protein